MSLVVVIDDDWSLCRLMREILLLEGYRVRVAANGRDGLRLQRRLPCRAVVLLDLLMPPPDGRDVLLALNAEPAWRARFAIIVHSALANLKTLAPSQGMDDTLVLPFNVDQLLAVVQHGEALLAARPRQPYINLHAYLRPI